MNEIVLVSYVINFPCSSMLHYSEATPKHVGKETHQLHAVHLNLIR